MKKIIFALLIIFLTCISIYGIHYFSNDKVTTITESKELESSLIVHYPKNLYLISDNNNTLKKKVLNNDRFMHTSIYDKYTNNIFAPTYSPEESFAGLTVYGDNKKPKYLDLDGFGPVNIVGYNGELLMDSAQSFTDKNGEPITQLGLYNLSENKFTEKLKVDGVVQAIVLDKQNAYISSFAGGKKSNIYKYDFENHKLEKVLVNDMGFVPNKMEISNNRIIGLVNKDAPGRENDKNQLVIIQDRKVIESLKFEKPVLNFTVFNNKLLVIKNGSNGNEIDEIDINTLDKKTIDLNVNPTNIHKWRDDLVIVEPNGKVTLFDKTYKQITSINLSNKKEALSFSTIEK